MIKYFYYYIYTKKKNETFFLPHFYIYGVVNTEKEIRRISFFFSVGVIYIKWLQLLYCISQK